ncbi:hypothetical protein I79_015601 [Cricetulus griseus]|uniref:Uncharacterized protein n=1 Tax=Cricetulus griseus TaxID=10029 RepID=G3HX82_CRIGR|nr:hypothetical protein I79_015601 [Cricetulus griseus]
MDKLNLFDRTRPYKMRWYGDWQSYLLKDLCGICSAGIESGDVHVLGKCFTFTITITPNLQPPKCLKMNCHKMMTYAATLPDLPMKRRVANIPCRQETQRW